MNQKSKSYLSEKMSSTFDMSVLEARNTQDIRRVLKEYGVCIVPSLLNQVECDHMEDGMWDYLECVSSKFEVPIVRGNVSTYGSLEAFFPMKHMLLKQFGIGQCQMLWDLRENVKCADVFAGIWKCEREELLVSFDGGSFHFPSEWMNKRHFHDPKKTVFHTDQNFNENAFQCVQSWVTAFDVEEGDATLLVKLKSHLLHGEAARRFPALCVDKKHHYRQLKEAEEMAVYAECPEVAITCPRGSMVLWDSRTLHCGRQPMQGRANPKIRCIAYLCYMRRDLAHPREIEKKIKAFHEMRTTSHWPGKLSNNVNGRIPHTYGKEVLEMTPMEAPRLGALGRKLAGF